MTPQNFKKRIKLGLVFIIFALIFYVVTSEDLLQYIVLINHPGLQNNKILVLHLVANLGLVLSKGALGVLLLIIYDRLKGRGIPFVGFIWIFAMFFIAMSVVFAMNILSFWRVYIWIDGLLRAIGGVVGIAAAITLYKALPYISHIKSPEEYGRLADELHALREENSRLEKILEKSSNQK